MRGRRRRELSHEERSLWKQVTDTAAPLRPPLAGATLLPPPASAAPARERGQQKALVATAARAADRPALPARPSAPGPAAPRPPALAHLDRKMRREVARGSVPIDDRLDLHGMRQHDAHDRLLGFLRAVQARGGRMVLVITGKGEPSAAPFTDERGVLRRAVPHWLSSPAFRPLVIAYEEAHRSHGGGGALYIRLRRHK